MHEYPLTQRIIETAVSYAEEHGAKRVCVINLVVGDFCGYVADSIALYFDIIAAGSPCEGAELRIERVRPMLKCGECGKLFERKPFSFDCPLQDCAGKGEPTETGREFLIRSIQVE